MMKTTINTKDNTEALGYAVYMMLGSYFSECMAVSEITESRLLISYKEAGNKLQYVMEEMAEKYGKDYVFPLLPADAFKKKVAVSFDRVTDSCMTVTFRGRDLIIRMDCFYVNRKCLFKHRVYVRKGDRDCRMAA